MAHTGVADAEWDFALQRMGGHFLQSTLWQRVQAALGHDVIWARDEHWMWAGAIRAGHFPRYVYLPHGPTAASEDAMIVRLRRRGRRPCAFARLRPCRAGGRVRRRLLSRRSGAHPSRSIQPRWTWILDLTPDEAALRRGLSSGHRGAINAASRRGPDLPRERQILTTSRFSSASRSAPLRQDGFADRSSHITAPSLAR